MQWQIASVSLLMSTLGVLFVVSALTSEHTHKSPRMDNWNAWQGRPPATPKQCIVSEIAACGVLQPLLEDLELDADEDAKSCEHIVVVVSDSYGLPQQFCLGKILEPIPGGVGESTPLSNKEPCVWTPEVAKAQAIAEANACGFTIAQPIIISGEIPPGAEP